MQAFKWLLPTAVSPCAILVAGRGLGKISLAPSRPPDSVFLHITLLALNSITSFSSLSPLS